ncbi:NAD(P)/FAD-dependent oxidoreductase [Cohnella panacarvi]|uniref:NAD(P)/FAD-dependent oxidoreductase n=1 Tax=Cohnella panacarvi TaxID=400776 RepID=UPI00047DB2E3|nr:FAD-dependent oxidoreductase [Cohnella panacarvi]
MSLHFGTLYWPETCAKPASYAALNEDVKTRVAIVGGGMSGVACGYELARSGMEAVLIEQGRIAGGSSAANSGIVQFMSDRMLGDFIGTLGERDAVTLYRACLQAVERLLAISERLPRGAQARRRCSLYYASTPEEAAPLRQEYELLRRHGFGADWWDASMIAERFPFRKDAAILTHGDAEFNPYLFVLALAEEAVKLGLSVYEHTALKSVHHAPAGSGARFVVETSGGTIEADHIVYAVGYTPEQAGGRWIRARTCRTYAIVTDPLASLTGWHERCLLWETARPYLYARTTPDNRLVVGGLDENLRLPVLTAKELRAHSLRLLSEMNKLFPQWKPEIRYEWCGSFCESADGLPWIGEDPDRPGQHYLLGYGGNGAVYSMLGANVIRDNLTGNDHPASTIVRPDRRVAIPGAGAASSV